MTQKTTSYKSMGITRPHELNDSHVVVEGILEKVSKRMVKLTEVDKIAFLPKR